MKLTRHEIELRSLKGLERNTQKFSLKPDDSTREVFTKKQGIPDYDRIIFRSKKDFVEYDYEGYKWRGQKLILYLGDRTRYSYE